MADRTLLMDPRWTPRDTLIFAGIATAGLWGIAFFILHVIAGR